MTDAPYIETARARLRVLTADTEHPGQREHRRVTERESLAIQTMLDELHRLHVAVSDQRETIEKLQKDLAATKQADRNPPVARSKAATTRNTTRKHGVHE